MGCGKGRRKILGGEKMTMRNILAVVGIGGLLVVGVVPAQEDSELAELAYSELISHGIISAYSTNVLVRQAFAGRCLGKEDALEAVERNSGFVKVLQRYAHSLRRSTKIKDEGMKRLVAEMCDVTGHLKFQTDSLKDWIENPESGTAKGLYERYTDKLEKMIESMLRGGSGARR
jgi:hypothetical protein